MAESIRNFINGSWSESSTGRTFETRNPADTDEVVGVFQDSGAEDAERAVEAANDAKAKWAGTPAPDRGQILRRASNHLADRKQEATNALVREEGKTEAEAAGEVQRAIDIFAYYGEKAADIGGSVKSSSSRDTHLYTVDEPLGVAAIITPWNYPIAIPAWKLAPALATGNTVVFKPASLAPDVAWILVVCLEAAGIPDGVVNFVTGPGSTVGSTLATHGDVDAVSFTGSSAVGDTVYQQATEDQKRVQMEMGGKNPVIVMPSADIETAADIACNGAFGVTGQACTATSRAIVHESHYDAFVEAVVDRAESLTVGHGLDGADVGPQVSERELASTLEYVDIGVDEGATLETGGERPTTGAHANGYFVEPAVFSDVAPNMQIAQEEIFGPVLSVIPVASYDEAVAVANDVDYGLSASIVTNDLREANAFVTDNEAGVAKVNEKTTGLELHVPFGGMKSSSSETYREQGDAGMKFFTLSKTVYMGY
jgi:aldehyde dehydrogenase (NAD+)